MRILVVSLTACVLLNAQIQSPDARTLVNEGVKAFKAARHEEATQRFQQAVGMEPNNETARLYLATSYFVRWIPGADSPDNEELARRAEGEFQEVLRINPGNTVALSSLASLTNNRAKATPPADPGRNRLFEEAAGWYRKVLLVNPSDKVALYALGVIAWEQVYPEVQGARRASGMRPETPGPITDTNLRTNLRARFEGKIEEGINNLQRALVADSKYDDAMAYLNLMYRLRADLREAQFDYAADIAQADDWVRKALATKKEKVAASAGPNVAEIISCAPPPPPPPAPNDPGTGPQRIRIGGNVQAANLVSKIEPTYPPLAKQARVQGTVRFTVIIDREGSIQNMQLISGHPLLVPSAQEAVKQWRYRPTFLNGGPVEVITQVDVHFTLSEPGL